MKNFTLTWKDSLTSLGVLAAAFVLCLLLHNLPISEGLANIRKKLGIRPGDNRYIINELGVGYRMQEENEMDRLRKMDAKVTQKATIMSLVLGMVGALVMGMGMSLVMTDLGATVGISSSAGIMIGMVGMILVALAYPVYDKVQRKEREKIAPEILKLTEELMK